MQSVDTGQAPIRISGAEDYLRRKTNKKQNIVSHYIYTQQLKQIAYLTQCGWLFVCVSERTEYSCRKGGVKVASRGVQRQVLREQSNESLPDTV